MTIREPYTSKRPTLRDKPAFPKLTPNLPKSQVVSTGDFGKLNPAICPQWQLTENVTSQALRDFTSGLAVTLQERQSLHSSRSIRTLAMVVAALGLRRVTGNPGSFGSPNGLQIGQVEAKHSISS